MHLIEEQIAKVMVTVRPTRAIVVEHPKNLGCFGIDCDIVETEIAMNEGTITGGHVQVVIGVESAVNPGQETSVTGHLRQASSHPVAGLRPFGAAWQPLRNVV